MKRLLAAGAFVSLGVGCIGIGTSPEEAEANAWAGQGEDEGSPEHRPGEPCLLCHREGFSPGEETFVVAGTVYLYAADANGIEGAEVVMEDAVGHSFVALTNRTGNFMVGVDGSLAGPEQHSEGRLFIPYRPVFPLRASVRMGADEKIMKSFAWRDGSCAGCHQGVAETPTLTTKVYLRTEGR